MGLIYLDTCILIYLYESGPHTSIVKTRLANEQIHHFAISPLVRMECLVGAMKKSDLRLQQTYEHGLDGITTLPITNLTYTRAARLRATYGLKTPDALHLATAEIHGCVALWTNDNRLASASERMARNILTSM